MQFCRSEDIAVTAYSPLGSPESGQISPLMQDPQVLEIAAEHGCSPAQVLLAWGIACGTAVIPKSVRQERLAANLAAAGLVLTTADISRLNALDRHQRFVDGSFWDLPGGPYPKQSVWDE
jgi:alcohol dehydrogenase (NADP+)